MRSPSTDHAEGLTIMELLIGLIIVGILVTMALPGFGKAMERARVKDAQAILASIANAERVYRIDQGAFGRVDTSLAADDLIRGQGAVPTNYISNPDPSNSNADWNFASSNVAAATFTLTATRTGGGQHNNSTITVDQAFNGSSYGGTHTLRDS